MPNKIQREEPTLKRSNTVDKIQRVSTTWRPISIEGQFIIMYVAMTFLTNDYEYSLRMSSTDFSYVANSSIFEGNALRFRALASSKLFEYALNEEGDLV